MSEHVDLEPVAGPQTARLGGRRSAVLGTLAVVAVLVAMVWVGMSGRVEAPPAPPAPAEAAVLPTDVPATPGVTAAPTTALPAPPDGPIALATGDVFGVYAEFGTNQYITIMSEPEPGHLVGRLHMPLPIPSAKGTLVFEQFSSPDVRGQPVYIGDWPVNVEAVGVDTGEHQILSVSEAGQARSGAPRPVIYGFGLTVNAQRDIRSGEFRIDVLMKPGRQIAGNDGIFGWPTVALLPTKPTSYPVSALPDIHRPDNGNQCRWYEPVPGTDEADCLSVPY